MPILAANAFTDLMARGGVVMWPLLVLSVVALTLILERTFFYLMTNNPARLERVSRLGKLLRAGKVGDAKQQAAIDRSVYGDALQRLLDEELTEPAAVDAVEHQRARLERFLPVLSTIRRWNCEL